MVGIGLVALCGWDLMKDFDERVYPRLQVSVNNIKISPLTSGFSKKHFITVYSMFTPISYWIDLQPRTQCLYLIWKPWLIYLIVYL